MKYFYFAIGIITLTIFSSRLFAQEITIDYPDFADLSKWQLNGVPLAHSVENRYNEHVLRLTGPSTHHYGSAFLKDPIPLEDERGFRGAFSAFFSFRIGDGQNVAGADGITFTIQTVANNIGSDGGGLGYFNIPRSVAIEFDTWTNEEYGDIDASHIGIDTGGSIVSIVTRTIDPPMDNYQLLYAWVDYNGDTKLLELRLSQTAQRPDTATVSSVIDIPKIIQTKNAYIGFTAATGAAWNSHEIVSFKFTNKFKPFTYLLNLSASPDTIVKSGDTVTLTASVFDETTKERKDLASLTKWNILKADGNPLTILHSSSGSIVTIAPVIGGSGVVLEATVDSGEIHLKKQINLQVKAISYQLNLSASPDTVISYGDTVTLTANVFDDLTRTHSEMSKMTKWSVISPDGNPPEILLSSAGGSVKVVPSVPSSHIIIEASVDSATIHLKKQISLHVNNAQYTLTISASPDTLINSGDTITLTASISDDLMRNHPGISNQTHWNIISADGNPSTILLSTIGGSVKVVPSVPSSSIIIEASADSASIHLKRQITLHVNDLIYKLKISASPDTIVFSGDTVTLISGIIDNLTHNHPAMSDLTNWNIKSADGNPPTILLSDSGKSIKVVPTIPQSQIVFEATVDSSGVHLTQQITLRVKMDPSVPSVKAAILDSVTENRKAILILVFNEKVNVTMLSSRKPSDVILYTSSKDVSVNDIFANAIFRVHNNSTFFDTITVDLGTNGALIVPFLDSLKIGSGTVNQSNVAPKPINAPNTPITTDNRHIRIFSSSNPFSYGMKPDSRVIRFFNITNQYSGSVASIFTSIPFRKNSDNSYGTAIIYDVVGNIVKKDIKIYSCPANVHYYYFQWDGLNSNSRVVGNGSYLSIISVQDIQGQKSVLRYKIGVKSD